jgi:hypothetical protein
MAQVCVDFGATWLSPKEPKPMWTEQSTLPMEPSTAMLTNRLKDAAEILAFNRDAH